MNRKLTLWLLVIALLANFCLPALGGAENAASSSESTEIWDLIAEAYIYAFPLVLTDATKTLSTNTEAAENGRAPVNQFNHAKQLANATTQSVVTPNVDTIYTQAWLELGDEPMIYVLPETDRFMNVQILDAWTNTAALLDQPGTYAIALADWKGELPEGVTRVDVPTETVWTIARIVLSGEEDLPNVYEIQSQMQLTPLSAYLSGEEYSAPAGTYSADNEFVPLQKVLTMGPKAFFDRANKLMTANPPAEADAELLERLAAIQVCPGMTFDATILGANAAEQWTQMLTGLQQTMTIESVNYAQKLGQWTFYGAPIGDFGTAYSYRAMVAMTGLGANTVDVAIYPKTSVDSDGNALSGENSYVLHFDALPISLEGGFWSVTAYGSDNYLIDNALNRYCVNDRSDFVFNEDGSLDILLCAQQPENTENWLPVSDEAFHLILRIYLPDIDALSDWQPPVITLAE